jgi:lantibiotic transport system permease protein
MLTLISVEAIKLRRSLALALCLAAPACVAFICLLFLVSKKGPSPWHGLFGEGLALWAYFMLPMSVTALTVLIAQIEHGPRMWNYILAHPVPRWRIFAAKAIIAIGMAALMTGLFLAMLIAVGFGWSAAMPEKTLTGVAPFGPLVQAMGYIFLASFALVAVQLWVALRFRSFVPPLTLGIMGTFGALAVTASKQFYVFPWLLSAYAMQIVTPQAQDALVWGFFGGLVLFAAMCVDLSHREKLVMG